MKKSQGFTLIELVVVIVILGILAATALPKFVDLGGDARMAVMKSVEGSMRSANSMIYAKAATAGQTGLASGSVTINSTAITTKYGFASDTAQLILAMDLDTGKVNVNGTTDLFYVGYSSCKVTYTAPASAGLSPAYSSAGVTTTNC